MWVILTLAAWAFGVEGWYPREMPLPQHMMMELPLPYNFGAMETPVAVYGTAMWDSTGWSCIAFMSELFLDGKTTAAPTIRAPEGYRTSRHRVTCLLYAFAETFPALWPQFTEAHKENLVNYRLADAQYKGAERTEVINCVKSDEASTCLQALMPTGDDIDLRMAAFFGLVVGAESVEWYKSHEFNAMGDETCRFNCRYKDTTGYKPVNTPWEIFDDTRWQPLLESNDLGFFYAQEHVTPHIGRGETFTVPAEFMDREAPVPSYDYASIEIGDRSVIAQVASLANDDKAKAEVEIMDDKIKVFVGVLNNQFNNDYSYEETTLFNLGYTAGEVDTVAVTWKEKVRHDRIRPTSRIQNDESLDEFLPWYDGTDIHRSQWTPFMRVMPHAEYPSGSSSICHGVKEYVNAWITDKGMDTNDFPISFTMKAGSSKVQMGFPAQDITLLYANMEELAEACAQSRVTGGMHYPESITASEQLVQGFGAATYQWTRTLVNGGSFGGIPAEDLRPRCGKKGKIVGRKSDPVKPVRVSNAAMDGPCACKDACIGLEMAYYQFREGRNKCLCFPANARIKKTANGANLVGATDE